MKLVLLHAVLVILVVVTLAIMMENLVTEAVKLYDYIIQNKYGGDKKGLGKTIH
jgi:hypothetical protein